MKQNKIILAIAVMIITIATHGQQNPVYNQYVFNPMSINPAYAGTKQWLNLNNMYSKQWAGLEGSPQTISVSLEGPVNEKMGLGVQYVNDRIGAQTQQGLFLKYSYILRLTDTWKLSMGLTAGLSYFTINGGMLEGKIVDDPRIPKTKASAARFDPKTGVFLYSDRFYFGFSVNDLLGGLIESKNGMNINQHRHYYITSGYVFDIAQDFKLKPSILIREDFTAQTNIDLSTYMLYKEIFWLGATYRFGANILTDPSLDNSIRGRDAVVLMTDWNITNTLTIGYGYTFSIGALSKFSGHEVVLNVLFPQSDRSVPANPRLF